jgi:hypothetical protein
MIVQIVPGALHLDIPIGGKACGDLVAGKAACLKVVVSLRFKREFQAFANEATHGALQSWFEVGGARTSRAAFCLKAVAV